MESISPKIDIAFRKVFSSPENKDLLISLLNSIVGPEIHLTDVVIKNPYNLATYKGSKESIVDIKAVDQNGIWYDIEMQITPHGYYGKRALYYVSKMYVDQLADGAEYVDLRRVIGIHLIDFEYFKDDRHVRRFVLQDAETKQTHPHVDYVSLYFVEMPKFLDRQISEPTALDRWVAFFNQVEQADPEVIPPFAQFDPEIAKAFDVLRRIGYNEDERHLYDAEVKAKMVDKAQLEYAKEEGREEGREEVLSMLLRKRFSTLPESITARLDRLTSDQWTQLADAIFNFGSMDDLAAWLDSL